ncbi:MAG: hypothetical protein CMH53_05015 [Myxococcales bacterium]|nr:hypothetical protein [Myxococcales bacterium]
MLKATLIGRRSESEEVLNVVMDAGLLHIAPFPLLEAHDESIAIHCRLEEASNLRRVRSALLSVSASSSTPVEISLKDLIDKVDAISARRLSLQERLISLDATIETLRPWGDFDVEAVDALQGTAAEPTFARLTGNDWKTHKVAQYPHGVSHRNEDEVWVVLFGPEAAKLPIAPTLLPRVRLRDVKRSRREARAGLLATERSLRELAGAVELIDGRLADLSDQLQVLEAIDEGLTDDTLFGVCGYLPAENQLDLQRDLASFGVVLRLEDPQRESSVPVKLRNKLTISGFEAIVRSFSGISYWEKDFTPVVGPLFMVFGALCLLDGGYGLLLLITGLWLKRRGNADFGNVFTITGIFSIFVGMLAGQYFGLIVGQDDFLPGHHPPTMLAADPMASFIFSLVVGMLGMTWSYATAIWQRGWRTNATGSLLFALGVVSTVAASTSPEQVASLFIRSQSPTGVEMVAQILTYLGYGLLGAGGMAWCVFPERVFGDAHVPNVAWTLYSGVTGFGQDTMSHMRLFGIALSGSIMAMVVNQISALFPTIVTILIAVVGHFFVYLLALLSLYIHTNRLIFLEFGSKCFDGGQHWYSPLRREGKV